MRLSDFDFTLPRELVAQEPLSERSAARLLEVVAGDDRLVDRRFVDLASCVGPDDLLVMNDTKVVKARLHGHKDSGGRVQVLVERLLGPRRCVAQVRASKAPKPGGAIRFEGDACADVVRREDAFFELELRAGDWTTLLDRAGELPLPPYITRPANADDEQRYQTVYAQVPGAVAAPTAGLHFDAALLDRLSARGVATARITLHVGAGTFTPVRTAEVSCHRMHAERYTVGAEVCDKIRSVRQAGGKVVAVGTTCVRALESAFANASPATRAGRCVEPYSGETNIFITPGYSFGVVDALVTNFHLPQSTLLMLVCAFAGFEEIQRAYRHAVAERYRFFSYGDAMLLYRNATPSMPPSAAARGGR